MEELALFMLQHRAHTELIRPLGNKTEYLSAKQEASKR